MSDHPLCDQAESALHVSSESRYLALLHLARKLEKQSSSSSMERAIKQLEAENSRLRAALSVKNSTMSFLR